MHNYPLLEILAAGFALALLFGYIAHRLKLSPIVGYLLAGYLAGPLTPGFVADPALAFELSEAGVILLMFGVGLHFKLEDLLAVKNVALPGAVAQSLASAVLGTAAGVMYGLPLEAGLILGMGLAVASTVVLLRVLEDGQMVNTVHGHVAVGWLVVEDIFTVLLLVLLPSLAGIFAEAGAGTGLDLFIVGKALGFALLNLAALWVIVLVVGGKVVPWLLTHIVRTRSQELFTLTVLVAAFATAVGAAEFFHASMALGAFLGGMVVGKTTLSHQAGADLLPLRDAFAVLFFLSVGMLFDPGFLLQHPELILLSIFIVLIVKPLVAMVVVTLLGYTPRTGLTVAFGLAQVGEFSFILASTALGLKMIPDTVYYVLVACALVSITLNPGLFRTIPRVEAALRRHPRLWNLLNARADAKAARSNTSALAKAGLDTGSETEPQESGHAKTFARTIIVGYGPTGRSVDEALRANGVTTTIVEFNVDTVNDLTRNGRWAVFGDASRKEVLEAAGIGRADYLVLTLPQLEATLAAAATARNMNPDVRILTRARFLGEKRVLQQAGVNGIAFEEEEVAKSLADLVEQYIRECDQGECPIIL